MLQPLEKLNLAFGQKKQPQLVVEDAAHCGVATNSVKPKWSGWEMPRPLFVKAGLPGHDSPSVPLQQLAIDPLWSLPHRM